MRNTRLQNFRGKLASGQRSFAASRRGSMMLWSVWVFLAMLMIVACTFNVIWLSCVRSEARRHAESAVVVGGHAFLSDDMLRLHQQSFENAGREVRCRSTVVDHICQAGDPSLASIITQHDVELISPCVATGSVNTDQTQVSAGPTHAVPSVPDRIQCTYGKYEGNDQLRMFFSGLTNTSHARLGVSACANIEHAPVGFLPGGSVTIPVLPFGILEQSSSSPASVTGGLWSQQIESGKGSDNATWQPDQHSVEDGPDGLSEIVLTLSPNSAGNQPDSLIPLKFAATSPTGSNSQTVDWMQNGVSSKDLNSLGLQQLSFPSTVPAGTLSRQECGLIAAWLQSHTGHSFIVCLCQPTAGTAGTTYQMTSAPVLSTVQLKRAVAARIMGCGISPAGDVRVMLQPCVLITSTAITSPSADAALNRYIYSVRLCQ